MRWSLDALTSLAVVGQHTRRIELGTAVVPTWSRHPYALCDDAALGRATAGRRYGLYQQIPTYARMLARGDARSPADVAVVGSEADVRARLRAYASAGVTDLLAMVFEVGPDPSSRAASRLRTEALVAELAA